MIEDTYFFLLASENYPSEPLKTYTITKTQIIYNEAIKIMESEHFKKNKLFEKLFEIDMEAYVRPIYIEPTIPHIFSNNEFFICFSLVLEKLHATTKCVVLDKKKGNYYVVLTDSNGFSSGGEKPIFSIENNYDVFQEIKNLGNVISCQETTFEIFFKNLYE